MLGGYFHSRLNRAFDFLLVTVPDLGTLVPDLVTRQGLSGWSSQWQSGQKMKLHLTLLQIAWLVRQGADLVGGGVAMEGGGGAGERGVVRALGGVALVTRQGEVQRGQ